MHAVVVDRLSGDVGALAAAAAKVLGTTAYDVRASMHVPGGGPSVLAVFGEAARAEATCAQLRGAGFFARVVPVQPQLGALQVQELELRGDALVIGTRLEELAPLRYQDIDLLVRANAMTTNTNTKTVRERTLAPVRTVLSGGLVNTKVQTKRKTTRSTTSEELLFVFSKTGASPVRLAQDALRYQSLGAEMKASRNANFAHVVAEIRRRSPQAVFDERLRRRAVASQILGRTLSADDYFEFAVALVAASLSGDPSPR